MKNPPTIEMDEFDRKIVAALIEDGRMTVPDLAQAVGLSKTPCQVRLRRLIETGAIRGFRATVDPATLGLGHVAFAEVKLSDTREKGRDEFTHAVPRRPEDECYPCLNSISGFLPKGRKDAHNP